LEASADLECSIQLAASHFYKQASSVLRTYLEGQLVDLLLAQDDLNFSKWKAGTYRVPSIRGRRGLLTQLERTSLLDSELQSTIAAKYDDLNASIHGAEHALIHSGVFDERYSGHVFRPDKFTELMRRLSDVTDICLHLMKLKTMVWARTLKSDMERCTQCRERDLADLGGFVFGNCEFIRRRCKSCGHKCTIRKDTNSFVYLVTAAPNAGDRRPPGPAVLH
jgi:hypothetical protein